MPSHSTPLSRQVVQVIEQIVQGQSMPERILMYKHCFPGLVFVWLKAACLRVLGLGLHGQFFATRLWCPMMMNMLTASRSGHQDTPAWLFCHVLASRRYARLPVAVWPSRTPVHCSRAERRARPECLSCRCVDSMKNCSVCALLSRADFWYNLH